MHIKKEPQTQWNPHPTPNQMEAAPFGVTSPPRELDAPAPGPRIPQEGSEVTSSVHQHWCQHILKVILILEPWVRKTPQTSDKNTEINILSQDGPSPKPTILDCPQVLKSHSIHGEDPIPTTGRCISKKNPNPNGTHIQHQIRWKQHLLQWHLHPVMLLLQHLAQGFHRRDLKSLHLDTNTGVNTCSR